MDVKDFNPQKETESKGGGFSCDNIKGIKNILLDTLDELNIIVEDLKVLMYLNVIVQEDFAGGYVTPTFESLSKDEKDMYLLGLQMDDMKKLESQMKEICQ